MAIATCCCKVYFAQGPNLQISIPFPEHSYYLCCLIVFSFAYDHSQPFRDSLVSPSLSCAKRTNIYTSTLFYLFPHEYDIPFLFFSFQFRVPHTPFNPFSGCRFLIDIAIMARPVCCPCYSSSLDVLTYILALFFPYHTPSFSLSTILHLMSKAFFT